MSILAEHVARSYRTGGGEVVALHDLSLAIPTGTIFALLGPNGAGKTTFVKVCTTLLTPTSGDVHIDGLSVTSQTKLVRRRIGVSLGGDRGLYFRISGRRNLQYFAALAGLSHHEAEAQIGDLLERVGLTEAADRRTETYSRGMRQRLHLARAMLGNPRVIFLDEPTSGIDPRGVRDMHRIIQGFASDGRTVVVTTHQLNELPLFCERVGILHGGRLLYEDSLAAMEARALDIEGALVVSLAGVGEADLAALRAELEARAGVHTETSEADGVITLRVTGPNLSRLTTDSLGRLSALGDAVRAIDVKRASLDDVYLSIVESAA